jgi:hypothetical protein
MNWTIRMTCGCLVLALCGHSLGEEREQPEELALAARRVPISSDHTHQEHRGWVTKTATYTVASSTSSDPTSTRWSGDHRLAEAVQAKYPDAHVWIAWDGDSTST